MILQTSLSLSLSPPPPFPLPRLACVLDFLRTVAWISSLEDVVTVSGKSVLALQVDSQWVARANAKAPFSLRNVYVQVSLLFMLVFVFLVFLARF